MKNRLKYELIKKENTLRIYQENNIKDFMEIRTFNVDKSMMLLDLDFYLRRKTFRIYLYLNNNLSRTTSEFRFEDLLETFYKLGDYDSYFNKAWSFLDIDWGTQSSFGFFIVERYIKKTFFRKQYRYNVGFSNIVFKNLNYKDINTLRKGLGILIGFDFYDNYKNVAKYIPFSKSNKSVVFNKDNGLSYLKIKRKVSDDENFDKNFNYMYYYVKENALCKIIINSKTNRFVIRSGYINKIRTNDIIFRVEGEYLERTIPFEDIVLIQNDKEPVFLEMNGIDNFVNFIKNTDKEMKDDFKTLSVEELYKKYLYTFLLLQMGNRANFVSNCIYKKDDKYFEFTKNLIKQVKKELI